MEKNLIVLAKCSPEWKHPPSFFSFLMGSKITNQGPQLNKHATNGAELKCNRCCCSWTRLRPGASHSAWLLLPGCCCWRGFFATPHPSPSTSLSSFFSGMPFSLLSSLSWCIPNCSTSSHFIHHFNGFTFLARKATGFISEKLKRLGKATSITLLGHVSIEE